MPAEAGPEHVTLGVTANFEQLVLPGGAVEIRPLLEAGEILRSESVLEQRVSVKLEGTTYATFDCWLNTTIDGIIDRASRLSATSSVIVITIDGGNGYQCVSISFDHRSFEI